MTTPLSGLTKAMELARGVQDAFMLSAFVPTEEEAKRSRDMKISERLQCLELWIAHLERTSTTRALAVLGESTRAVNGSHGAYYSATVSAARASLHALRKLEAHITQLLGASSTAINLKALTTLVNERFFAVMRTRWLDAHKDLFGYAVFRERHMHDHLRQLCAPPARTTPSSHGYYDDPTHMTVTYDDVIANIARASIYSSRCAERKARAASTVERMSEENKTAIKGVANLIAAQRRLSTRQSSKRKAGAPLTIGRWHPGSTDEQQSKRQRTKM